MRLIFCLFLLSLTACATTSGSKIWHVNPADIARFNADTVHCQGAMAGLRHYDILVDRCLQNHGYRLEITN